MSRKPVNFPNLVAGELRVGNTPADYGVYGTGTVQKFELGTRYRLGDQVFRYGKAEGNLNPQVAAFDHSTWFSEPLVAAATIGDMYIKITTDGTSGHVTNGFGVKNNMVGGYFSNPNGTCKQFRRIVSHDKGVATTTIKVYLDGPITRNMVNTEMAEWCPNPYRTLKPLGGNNRAAMGVPTTAIASGSFGWLQTWGPCWVAQFAVGDFGANYNQLARWTDGGNITNASSEATRQIAGFIMGARLFGNWANPPFIFLTINP